MKDLLLNMINLAFDLESKGEKENAISMLKMISNHVSIKLNELLQNQEDNGNINTDPLATIHVLNNFGEFCNKLGHKVKNLDTSKKEVWILLDGIDSGLSVNEIAEIPDFLKMVSNDIQQSKGLTPYILVAGNNYELIGEFKDRCLDAINLEYLTVNSYEEYRKIIFDSGELKEKRYEEGTKRIEGKKQNSKEMTYGV